MSTITADISPPATLVAPGLVVLLRRGPGGPVLVREPVLGEDLADAAGEFWRDRYLGRGLPQPDPATLRVVPLPGQQGGARFQGFALQSEPAAGAEPERLVFSLLAVEQVARRAEARLTAEGVLATGDKYHFELDVDPEPALPDDGIDIDFEGSVENRPLHLLGVPLAPLRERARLVGTDPGGLVPVFYTERVLERAEQFARQGATINPEFESGGVFAGVLCACPETGTFFQVVTEVYEVTDAEASPVSLEYSGKSWARIQSVIRARQQSDPAIELTGQCHGHNTLPGGGKTCAECLTKEVCTLTNIFASADDHAWTRAVFRGAPWCLCHVFGLSARGDRLHGLFTLHDGRLLERGFHVLPEFDPGGHPLTTVPR